VGQFGSHNDAGNRDAGGDAKHRHHACNSSGRRGLPKDGGPAGAQAGADEQARAKSAASASRAAVRAKASILLKISTNRMAAANRP
jgi:hypothetical protein